MASKTTRLEARLSDAERAQIERAAAIAEESVSSFVVTAAVERAEAVVEESATTVVPADFFDELLANIDRPDPAPKLRRAVDKARRGAQINSS